nr:Octaprenyl diphosphate synthase / Dimethylallyltransferase / (2E,6E)-farnesyl diphosphate synthase / Geranylgeranyl pyrophosphate synthetase [Kibdelosporangium sp. MJ126-NF4]CTQ99160.1 Octaprenyl diphosphate synthase (EC 2.5.1.90) / Dimethylallyltransferase (EC 2.5.1.1) / (2E,6E)-farnesyl diphosphate synthase (EC 2.5.1.10) / Geranylgeranyl pyrophosphate synthetase (EC 2.5.1.29) [Kibdelosporangium sp. MJ126-NF4]
MCAPRPVEEVLAEGARLVEPAYRAAVGRLPVELARVAGYHAGWWDTDGCPSTGMGKAVRPALVVACARACGADIPTDDTSGESGDGGVGAVGAAVEMVHDFSLLHDDVMDGDLTRRHRPAVWAVFGTGQAILVGDVLLTLALDTVGERRLAKVLTAALVDLCVGQSTDLAFEERRDVTLPECLAMAEAKTGALLGAACELGALAGGADSGTAACYRRFGRQVGVAFQLIDDLLGIWGDPMVTGKPAGADLVARKKSLPVVYALTSGTSASEHLAWLYGRDWDLDTEAIAYTADLVDAAGGRTWAQDEARRRIDAAMASLRQAAPDPRAAADLVALADLITRRDH